MGNFSPTKAAQQAGIVEAVQTVVKNISTNPENAKATFSAVSTLHEGLLADIRIRNFDLVADEPKSLGGTDEGPNPVELVLGAFAACQEIVIAAYAAVLDISVQRIDVTADGDLDLRGFFNVDEHVRPGFENIRYKTEVYTTEKDQQKLKQLEFFAVHRCPVLDILQAPVPVSGELHFKEAVAV